MQAIQTVSINSTFFPQVEVAYSDMLSWPYRQGGRGAAGIDCLGVVLEIYRRAGLRLPDPALDGKLIFEFADLFEQVSAPDHLYDIVSLRHRLHESGTEPRGGSGGEEHVEVVVRQEVTLTASAKKNVFSSRLTILKKISGVEFYRVKDQLLPR